MFLFSEHPDHSEDRRAAEPSSLYIPVAKRFDDTQSDVMISKTNEGSHISIWGITIAAVCVIALMLYLVGFCIIRRRRLKKNLQDNCETGNDPYIRPGGQLGSEPDFFSSTGTKKIHNKNSETMETIQKPTLPTLSFIRPRTQYESGSISLERHNSNSSVASTNISISSDTIKKTNSLSFPVTHITEPQRMKRSHRRTSSVTLSIVDVENITNKPQHKPINNHNSRFSSQNPSYSLRRSVLSNTLDTNSLIDDSSDIYRGSSIRSVNSLQWVGFNSSIIDIQNGRKLSLHVRNDFHRKSNDFSKSDSQDQDEYIIHGDYIDTTNRSNASHHYPGRNSVYIIPKQVGISEEEE